ncbi:MAG: LysM peptidoglycan-binding domain-containing protein [Balneolaceae bacterium]
MLKHLFPLFISAIVLLIIVPQFAQAQETGDTHVVQSGETLFTIARQYDLPVGDIRRWNQLQDDKLTPGAELKIGPPVRENATTHAVQQGETLFAISRQYDVTVAELQAWNGLDDFNLSVGQELVIFDEENSDENDSELSEETNPPIETELQEIDRESIVRDRDNRESSTYYVVRSGDTLNRIAREHNMSVAELRNLNNLQGDQIGIGQRLAVRDVQTAPSIAESAEESTPQGRFVNYRVERGESIEDLMDRFQMRESELEALNPDLDLAEVSSGQQITLLLPTSRVFENPYKKRASLEDLGKVPVSIYSESDVANPTTSGELYNPNQLTAAHSNMALGNVIYLENPDSGVGIYVKINDRFSGNGLKISQKAYDMLQFSSRQNAEATIFLDN